MLQIQGIHSVAAVAIDFATIALLLGLLTAAVMLALYDLGLRAILQRWRVRKWVFQRASWIENNVLLRGRIAKYRRGPILDSNGTAVWAPDSNSSDALARGLLYVLELVAGGGKHSTNLYALPYRQLCGKVSAAVHGDVDYSQGSILALFFGVTAHEEDFRYIGPAAAARLNDDPSGISPARARISAHMEFGLDDLQGYLGTRWVRGDYLTGLSVSGILILLWVAPDQVRLEMAGTATLSLLVVLAGLVSPLLRALLERMLVSR